jgi:hypothetical protein
MRSTKKRAKPAGNCEIWQLESRLYQRLLDHQRRSQGVVLPGSLANLLQVAHG